MTFAATLKNSLETRHSQFPAELAQGDDLESVLNRHLLAVEAMADRELLTSILLLDEQGERLTHGAAPNLPVDFCRAIDGAQIGPCAGSCGTAAYWNRPVYVTDIATDPLWAGYRDLALPHGLRACWSTPIRDSGGAVIGTFAVYHRTVGYPTADEIEAIQMITDHVSHAITWARTVEKIRRPARTSRPGRPTLRLVGNAIALEPPRESVDGLFAIVDKLQAHASELDRCADAQGPGPVAAAFEAAAADCRALVGVIRSYLTVDQPNR